MSLYLIQGSKTKKLKDKFFDAETLKNHYSIDTGIEEIKNDLRKSLNKGLDYYIWFASYAYEINGITHINGGFNKEYEIDCFWTNQEEI